MRVGSVHPQPYAPETGGGVDQYIASWMFLIMHSFILRIPTHSLWRFEGGGGGSRDSITDQLGAHMYQGISVHALTVSPTNTHDLIMHDSTMSTTDV